MSVKYKIPSAIKDTLYDKIEHLLLLEKTSYTIVNALQDISLDIPTGEVLGVIGENGSGKSTLIKIIANIIQPDFGKVESRGKIAPFIELSAGFEPELTVNENIILFGSIMGIKKKIIKSKIDEILRYSELEEWNNAKIKNLSSGMVLRLAFSIAMHINPDILLLDEILSVGDASFQKKSMASMMHFKDEGKTIVFVSHNLGAIKDFCNKAIFLSNGRLVRYGEPPDVINEYISGLNS